jgi:hypothetical protein
MNHLDETTCDRKLLRIGAGTAVAGIVAALVQTAIDPSMPDDPAQAVRKASESNMLAFSRLLDAAAFLLLLVAVAVATRALSAGRGAAWARIGLVFFTVSAGAGAIATMIVGALPDVADAWATAPAARKPGYVAVYDALDSVSGGVFAVSWAALGVFALLYAVGIAKSRIFPSPLVWIAAASGLASITAVIVGVGFQGGGAFLFLLLGLLLSYVLILSLGVKLWRLAYLEPSAALVEPAPLPGSRRSSTRLAAIPRRSRGRSPESPDRAG